MKISGFISYSHSDGKELTDDLYQYLAEIIPNFQPIYDENVIEGEKLEKIIDKLSLCKILIIIITPASLKSSSIAEEVGIAKKHGMKIIPCKDHYVKQDWAELPWGINEFKGFIFENIGELKRKLVFSLSKTLDELEDEIKPMRTKIETSAEQSADSIPIVLQTDKSVYMYNSDMICTVINPNFNSTKPINLKIFSEDNKLVYKNSIPINPNGNGIYQEIILVGGDEWNSKPGSQYFIIAEHENKKAELTFFLTSFGMTIELDQKVYTWTDKVFITVVAPDLVRDLHKIERIGNNEESRITIKTRLGKIENYELVETEAGSGIFTGSIRLTGFDFNPLGYGQIDKEIGKTMGKGPNGGMIAAKSDDGITVTLETKHDSIDCSALIRWNIGEVQWMKADYKIGDTGTFIIIDPDMNLNPNLIDIFKIRVWSDSDPVGTEVLAIETGSATGIFSGTIQFGTETIEEKSIRTKNGETVNVEYVDRTLPYPYTLGHELKILGMAKINS